MEEPRLTSLVSLSSPFRLRRHPPPPAATRCHPPQPAATRRHPQQVDYLAQTGSILALAGMLDEEDDADDYDEEDQAAFEELQALAAAAKAAKARGGGETKGDEPS